GLRGNSARSSMYRSIFRFRSAIFVTTIFSFVRFTSSVPFLFVQILTPLVVLPMGEDVPHVHHSCVVMNDRHEPPLVAADIENCVLRNSVGCRVDRPHILKLLPIGGACRFEPRSERELRLRVFLPEFSQWPPGDHVHTARSYFAFCEVRRRK